MRGSQTITAMFVLITFMLNGVTSASVLTDDTKYIITEGDVNQLRDEIIIKLCLYLQIRDQ